MRTLLRGALTAAVVVLGLAACGDDPPASSVPRLATSGAGTSAGPDDNDRNLNTVAGDGSAGRRAKLHAAAECIRQHGAPAYQDPVLTGDGYVYTDEAAFRLLTGPQLDAVTAACRDLIHAAGFSIRDQGPPPPALLRAGVKSAQCLRQHGLPKVKDPTVDTHFTPGHGFGLDPAAAPPGGKQSPVLQRAVDACRSILDQEEQASSLGNLGHA
ncbi:hypothetical protein ACQP2F_12400 [Actinoplanes sp. CA-030573]|uniref:hypothetical protein n=1 Tax=Actinoplanes sp. CA-030573 TaxID=3239898 RepID=UPI003D9162D4